VHAASLKCSSVNLHRATSHLRSHPPLAWVEGQAYKDGNPEYISSAPPTFRHKATSGAKGKLSLKVSASGLEDDGFILQQGGNALHRYLLDAARATSADQKGKVDMPTADDVVNALTNPAHHDHAAAAAAGEFPAAQGVSAAQILYAIVPTLHALELEATTRLALCEPTPFLLHHIACCPNRQLSGHSPIFMVDKYDTATIAP